MKPELIDVMQEQVRTIYRAATGTDVPEFSSSSPEPRSPNGQTEAAFAELTVRFAQLETLVRSDPFISELVPPFSFTPSLDAFCSEERIVIEVAVPGVDRRDLNVELAGGTIVISGVRRTDSGVGHRSHSEIPRGSFYREFHVPVPIEPKPDVALERGLLRIELKRVANPLGEGGNGHAGDELQTLTEYTT
jgi:HSP20 family molecular chaperone IbpA